MGAQKVDGHRALDQSSESCDSSFEVSVGDGCAAWGSVSGGCPSVNALEVPNLGLPARVLMSDLPLIVDNHREVLDESSDSESDASFDGAYNPLATDSTRGVDDSGGRESLPRHIYG